MRNLFTFFFALLLCATSFDLNAQCSCQVDPGCIQSHPSGGICIDTLPDAFIGQPYTASGPFYIPFSLDTMGLTITLLEITITGISGLPNGLTWNCSDPNCHYVVNSNPPNSQLGCVAFCGSPTANNIPGIYPITVNLSSVVDVPGFGQTTMPASYQTSLRLISTGGNTSYTFNPGTACQNQPVSFEALIDFAPQKPTTWSWDFGDSGNASTKLATHTYAAPGDYEVTLTTNVNKYVLTGLCVTGVSDDYCGDVGEPLCNCGTPIIGACPDLFFTLTDANGTQLYSSATVDNVSSTCWTGIDVDLTQAPFSLIVFDEEPLIVTPEQLGGTFAFNITNTGTFNFGTGAPGTTSGNYTIATMLDTSIVTLDTVTVLDCTGINDIHEETSFKVMPNPSGSVFNLYPEVATFGDVTIRLYDSAGRMIFEQNSAASPAYQITVDRPGMYWVEIRNAAGYATRKAIIRI